MASRILDIGTGTGMLIAGILSFAPTARVIGIDRSFGMLAPRLFDDRARVER